ncbi:MAG: IS66 family transposase [Anaerolineae bacterium]|nr:IS66 family transposase [Anaerolineae bacterium]MCO5196654.1 IS66 family transposase [Anaerolineae bacterium]
MDSQQENEQLKQRIQELEAALQAAQRQIAELTARLKQSSHNSHWPSSRDKSRQKKKRPKSLRRQSTKKAGGQKGHPGHTLEMSATPDSVRIHRPENCQHCQQPFTAEQCAVAIDKRQVHDLPPLRIVATEHQVETLCCPHCQHLSSGLFPQDVTAPVQYGSRIQQLAVYLKAEQFIPYERSRRFFADLFDLNLSPGTLQNVIQRSAKRLRPLIEQVKATLAAGHIVHCDESGFYINGDRHWLHVAATDQLTCYYPHRNRGSKAITEMGILPNFQGRAIHDFWSAYYQYPTCQHGLCNVHHLRDLTAIAEQNDQAWAKRFQWFLLSTKQVVDQARLAGATALQPSQVAQIERLYDRLVVTALQANPPPAGGWPQGKRGRPKKSKPRNFAERLDKHRHEVLAFVYDFKVPFDNNLAERDIRMLKVQQKISGCFRSVHGAQDFCTIRSYLSTMRKQGVRVWSALGSLFSGDILMPQLTPV